MQHDKQKDKLRRFWLQVHQLRSQDHVGRAGNGQQFGRPLDQRQDQDLDVINFVHFEPRLIGGWFASSLPAFLRMRLPFIHSTHKMTIQKRKNPVMNVGDCRRFGSC